MVPRVVFFIGVKICKSFSLSNVANDSNLYETSDDISDKVSSTLFVFIKYISVSLFLNSGYFPSFTLCAFKIISLLALCLYICFRYTVFTIPDVIISFKTFPGPTEGS